MEGLECEVQEIAATCRKVMENPHENLDGIRGVLGIMERRPSCGRLRGIVYLSLLKVFRAIIPTYKVRSLKDVVKDKRDSLQIKDYDKRMLSLYTLYVKKVVDDGSDESYVCACEMMEHLVHFNCGDKVVWKVLKGTTRRRPISVLCCGAIRSKLREDMSGDVVLMILDKMLDGEYDQSVVECLIDIPFLDGMSDNGGETGDECLTAGPRVCGKKKDSIFKRKPVLSKKLRKMERTRIQAQEEAKIEEEDECNKEVSINRKKVCDAMQRLYFTILKGNNYACYKYTFIGLMKYKTMIRQGFMEGLYFLLNNNLAELPSDAKIQGILCILSLYGEDGYDFKRLVDVVYSVLHPMNFELTEYEELVGAIRSLFMRIRQPVHRTHVLLSRLIVHGCSRFAPLLKSLIKELTVAYDIDPLDCDGIKYRDFDQDSTDTDMIPNNPFFEYCVYRKML